MPPVAYPVARSASRGSAIAALRPPRARASALRSSRPDTGTTATTRPPSRSASRVLKTWSGSRPRAAAASRPYDVARGSWSYSRRAKEMPALVSAAVAGVPPADFLATWGPSVGRPAGPRDLGGRQRGDDVHGAQLGAEQLGE